MTTTAIIGPGNMGKGLAKHLAGRTDLVLAARDSAAIAEFAASLPGQVSVQDIDSAIAAADIIILALPFAAASEIARKPGLAGKTVIDISNPVKPDFSGLSIGHTTSAAEELQALAPQARIVKAYNTIFAGIFDLPAAQTATIPVFLAGDDPSAVAAVTALVQASGFAVENVGGIDAARLLEPLGMLNIRLGYGLGRGTQIAPSWLAV